MTSYAEVLKRNMVPPQPPIKKPLQKQTPTPFFDNDAHQRRLDALSYQKVVEQKQKLLQKPNWSSKSVLMLESKSYCNLWDIIFQETGINRNIFCNLRTLLWKHGRTNEIVLTIKKKTFKIKRLLLDFQFFDHEIYFICGKGCEGFDVGKSITLCAADDIPCRD
jgi:hypothetical protein